MHACICCAVRVREGGALMFAHICVCVERSMIAFRTFVRNWNLLTTFHASPFVNPRLSQGYGKPHSPTSPHVTAAFDRVSLKHDFCK